MGLQKGYSIMLNFLLGQRRNWNIRFIVPEHSGKSMTEKVFRGSRPLAGNMRAESLVALIGQAGWLDELDNKLVEHLDEVADHEWTKNKVYIFLENNSDFIGWQRTISMVELSSRIELEVFQPNNRSIARRIKLDQPANDGPIYAPRTNVMTAVCVIKRNVEAKEWVVFLIDVYPGEPLGRLNGDVTKKTGLVFYHPEHLGVAV